MKMNHTGFCLVVLVFIVVNLACGLPQFGKEEGIEESLDEVASVLPSPSIQIEPGEPETEDPGLVEAPEQAVVAEEQIIRQWAVSALASSEYGSPDWSALQATGAPDTNRCGDYVTAWASYNQYTVEWLEVRYSVAVRPVEVNIHETNSPDQIVRVELIDTDGNYHEIYTARPRQTVCPYILQIPVEGAAYQVVGVKITVDQSQLDLAWNEIDAVELVGYSQESAPQPVAQEPADQEPVAPPVAEQDPEALASWAWTSYSKADGLADDNVRSIAVAPDGTVWVGTFGAGVASVKNGSFKNYSTADGLGHNQVMAIEVAPDGTVWAGTIVGLGRFDGNTWTNFTRSDGLIYESVYALAVTDGGLWIGTGKGVSFFDGSSWINYTKEDGLADNYVNDIAIDSTGGVWFATMKGVSYFDGSWTSFTEEDGLALNMVNTVAIGVDGDLWFGTSSGGSSHFDGVTWTTYADAGTIEARYVSAIRRAADGTLWFATQGDGAFRFDGRTWLQFSKKGGDGLPSDSLEAVAIAPDGAVWFGTQNKGIVRFGP